MDKPVIASVSAADYLLVRLVTASNGTRTVGQLGADLRSRLPPAVTTDALARLAERGLVDLRPRVGLTAAGRQAVSRRYGTLGRNRQRLASRVEPALALGLEPDGRVARRIARGDLLRAVVLTRLYQLPLDEATLTLGQATAALIRRRLAGIRTDALPAPLVGASASIGGDLSDVPKLRLALLCLALELGRESGDRTSAGDEGSAPAPETPPAPERRPERETPPAPERRRDPVAALPQAEFVERVLALTNARAGGPFTHKTPIADVYDAYGQRHPDAGSLASFKTRLLNAARDGALALLPLDDPDALDDETRQRSEIATPTRRLHFIERRQD